jgi:hypothetical protein
MVMSCGCREEKGGAGPDAIVLELGMKINNRYRTILSRKL